MDEWKDRSLTHYEDERGGGHLAAYSQQASERDPLSSLSIPLLGTIKAGADNVRYEGSSDGSDGAQLLG